PAIAVNKRERCHANICASSDQLLPARHQGRLRDSTSSQNPAPEETRSPVCCGRRSCTSRPLFPSAEYPPVAPELFQVGSVANLECAQSQIRMLRARQRARLSCQQISVPGVAWGKFRELSNHSRHCKIVHNRSAA